MAQSCAIGESPQSGRLGGEEVVGEVRGRAFVAKRSSELGGGLTGG